MIQSVENIIKWDLRFLKLAEHIASWSKDPSKGVGAVIAIGKKVISHGYNGFPMGVKDTNDLLNDRDEKYPRTIHAEQNAILWAQRDLYGYVIYCTHFPCPTCTGIILQSGIRRIVCYEPDEDFLSRWGDGHIISMNMINDVDAYVKQYGKETLKRFNKTRNCYE